MGESFVVAKGLDNCVSIYPKAEWERFLELLMTIPPSQRRPLQRFFGSGSEECTVDSQGRVVIPPKIREHAGLQKEIVVVGDTEKVEVWNRQAWTEYIGSPEFETENVAKIMEELGM
ncbi:MAG: cell division/cell wall cluster transcriptional repressor MraZ [Clostridia bacterium]|nr:cell division/cell wall cluster transcriptional repressor MraZ [Clostridia bacterium]